MGFAIPVLAYHSVNISGDDYATNDHVAFAEDLRLVTALGWRVASLRKVVDALLRRVPAPSAPTLALSLDDGTDFDFLDLPHPTFGVQRSMFGIVSDFLVEQAALQPEMHVTSFVVVASEAQRELDRTCLVGRGWWTDRWWSAAVASGRWGIANHSWDHNHHTIPDAATGASERGTFNSIVDIEAADAEIARAAARLRSFVPNPAASLFAYPYGESNDFLVREYFPRHHQRIGVTAAFDTSGAAITEGSDRWRLPRFVCGEHWESSDDLAKLLRGIR